MEEFRWVRAAMPASAASAGWGPGVVSMLQALGTSCVVSGRSEPQRKLLLSARLDEGFMKCNIGLQKS